VRKYTYDDLFDHQKDGVAESRIKPRLLVADDPGCGKTQQTIMSMDVPGRVLVVATTNSVGVWNSRVPQWSESEAVAVTKPSDLDKVIDQRWVIVTYDNVKIDQRKGHKNFGMPIGEISSWVHNRKFSNVVMDEVHKLSNRKAPWTVGCRKISSKANKVLGLTGTPIMNGLDGLWSVMNVVNPHKYSSFWDFMKKYANAKPGVYGWEYDKYPVDWEKVIAIVGEDVIRRLLVNVQPNMPPITCETVWLEPTNTQTSLFKEILKSPILETDDGYLNTSTDITKDVRGRQASVCPALLGKSCLGPKIPALLSLLDREPNEKFVVFSTFESLWPILKGVLDGENITCDCITGKVSNWKDRSRIEAEFQSADGPRVLFVTIEAGGEALTLTAARCVVFLDKHFNPAKNLQAVRRVFRTGQTRPVSVVDLRVRSEAEDHLFGVLDYKEMNNLKFEEGITSGS
jgi:SNF2 family DNA or RNA helicase